MHVFISNGSSSVLVGRYGAMNPVASSGCQSSHEFEFCPIPEKKRAVILSSIRKPQNQGMQVSAI